MSIHLKIVAWVHMVIGGIGLGLGLLLFVSMLPDPEYFKTMGWALWLFVLGGVYFVPAFLGGLGLLRRWSIAWLLVLIASLVLLPLIPVGTAFGAYSGWALFMHERPNMRGMREAEWNNMMRALGLVAIALVSLGAMIGLGYTFRDQIEALSPREKQDIIEAPPTPTFKEPTQPKF